MILKKIMPAVLSLISLAGPVSAGLFKADIEPADLHCEYRVDPLGIDTLRPRLSWKIVISDKKSEILNFTTSGGSAYGGKSSAPRSVQQTAYQILVASAPELLKEGKADLWDSGKVKSDASFNVEYAGKPLTSRQSCFWKVRVWIGKAETGNLSTSGGSASGGKPEIGSSKPEYNQASPNVGADPRIGDQGGALVEVNSNKQEPSSWSQPALWEMGLLSDNDWTGVWISRNSIPLEKDEDRYEDQPAPLLRRTFKANKKVLRARAYISGLGYYELRINGEKVGDHVLDPGWTSYSNRVLYTTYDVTQYIRKGDNAAGVMLGNGWYNPLPMRLWGYLNLREHLTVGLPRLKAELHIHYADGTSERIVSDASWKTAPGPILRNNVYLGEVYDARKELTGWDEPGFNDDCWEQAVKAVEPVGVMRCQSAPPIKVSRVIKPVAVTEPAPGIFVFDLGENIGGSISLSVRGQSGQVVTATCGELLYPDGRVNARTSACGQIKSGRKSSGTHGAPADAFHRYKYVLKGDGMETYTPRFAFTGFRYVEVEGFPGRPSVSALTGLVMHSDVESAGEFACSNELFNRIQAAFRRTLLSNLFSVQSDCPHREKFGYGGDMVACSEAAVYNFDMSAFYEKSVRDLSDCVLPSGGFTETAPNAGMADAGLGGGAGPALWGTAHPVLQKRLLDFYGNESILAEQYQTSQRWFDFLAKNAEDNVISKCLGDHESLAHKSPEVSSTAYYYHTVKAFSVFSGLLGRTQESARYKELADKIHNSFNKRFMDKATGVCKDGTQANQSFALSLGLVEDDIRKRALDALVKDVLQVNKGHLTTGIFGTDCLLQALSRFGRCDVAYTIVNQKTYPGWGFMFENGATTLWEHWQKDDNVFSHNHPMFGSVSGWFFKYLAGIQADQAVPGFKKIIIKPWIPALTCGEQGRTSQVEGPALTCGEQGRTSQVEGPALSQVEGPALSQVEGPALSQVEGPVSQGAEIATDLNWVNAHYDSINGRIVSNWKINGRELAMDVVIPPNTTATVYVPAGDKTDVTESGKTADSSEGVTLLRMEKNVAVYSVGSGTYKFRSVLPEIRVK